MCGGLRFGEKGSKGRDECRSPIVADWGSRLVCSRRRTSAPEKMGTRNHTRRRSLDLFYSGFVYGGASLQRKRIGAGTLCAAASASDHREFGLWSTLLCLLANGRRLC